ncbi:hypothetical protein Tco_1192068 [Tanacetum coccineum]
MVTKDTLSSCLYSDEQDMQQMLKQAKILKGNCLNGLSVLKSNFTRKLEKGITKSEFERAFSHIFGEDVDTFTRTFSQNMDTLEQQLTKETILESNCQNAFRVLKTQFEKFFSSVLIKPSSLDGMYARKDFRAYTSMEPQLFKEIILKNFDFIEDYMLKTIIHAQTIQKRLDDKKLQIQECTVQEVKALDAISKDKAKKSCMVSFQKLHSHLKHLSHDNLKGTRIESGFKRAFATLFGQDVETFIGTMFLNVDQLEKQLDKEEFQEIGSIASFKVLETQFQMFIKSRIYLDDEYVDMTRNKFLQYTRLEIPEFRDTLIQHMESVKKSIDERAQHKREYDSWVNERQIQTTEDKVDTGKAVDASLVNTESIGTESKEQDTSSRSGNDAHADDADIRPIYDEEPMVEVQTTAEINIFATGQQHTEQPEFNNEGKVDQNVEQCHDTCPLPAKLTDNQTTELSNQSLESENIRLKKTVAQFQKDFLRMEAHCVNLELKYQNQALKEGQHGQFLKVTSNEAKGKPTGVIFQDSCLRWVPTGKIFTPSTTKVDSEPPNGSNADITNQYECAQTLDVSAGTSNLSAGTSFNPKKEELRDSLLNVKEVPQADETITMSNELDLLFSMMFDELLNGSPTVVSKTSVVTTANAFDKHQQQPDSTSSTSTLATTVTADGNFDVRPYALSWKPCQGDSLNLPEAHVLHKDGDGEASIPVGVGFITTCSCLTTKTYYKHQDSRIMKAQELKTKTSAQTLIYKIFLQRYQVYQGRLLASFQDDAKYEHVGQDTRSQANKTWQQNAKTSKDLESEDVDTFTRTFSQNMDTLEQQLTKETILESNCQNAFRVLKTQFEKIFSSVLIKPSSLDVQDVKAIGCYIRRQAKKSLHGNFSKNSFTPQASFPHDNLKGTRIESGFKRAFATLFGQDVETFIGTMFLNMDQLEKQLDKEEFQEIGFHTTFKVLEIQFQMFIKSRMYLDDEFIIQTTEGKVDTGKAVDVSLVNTESIGTESKEQDTSSRSSEDAHADEADNDPYI